MRNFRRAAMFGIACGLAGPLAGLAILYIMSNVIMPQIQPAAGLVDTGAHDGAAPFLLYGISAVVLSGPLAAVLGGLASWLLISMRDGGASRAKVCIIGVILGLLLGGICVPLSFTVFLSVIKLSGGRWSDPFPLGGFWDPRSPYILAGLGTGLVLGVVVALLISSFRPLTRTKSTIILPPP